MSDYTYVHACYVEISVLRGEPSEEQIEEAAKVAMQSAASEGTLYLCEFKTPEGDKLWFEYELTYTTAVAMVRYKGKSAMSKV